MDLLLSCFNSPVFPRQLFMLAAMVLVMDLPAYVRVRMGSSSQFMRGRGFLGCGEKSIRSCGAVLTLSLILLLLALLSPMTLKAIIINT
jgi:cytochrome c biogenesis factor